MIIDIVPSILNTNWKAPKEKRKKKNLVNNYDVLIFISVMPPDQYNAIKGQSPKPP